MQNKILNYEGLVELAKFLQVDGETIERGSDNALTLSSGQRVWIGLTNDWEQLSSSEKALYSIVLLTDDLGSGITVVDSVEVGNINVPTSNAVALSLEKMHPIGDIIMSYTCDTEAKVIAAYGGSAWAQMQDRMLIGAGNTYSLGQTGGATTTTVTVSTTSGSGTYATALSSLTIGGHKLTTAETPLKSHSHGAGGISVKGDTGDNSHRHAIMAAAISDTNSASSSGIAGNINYHMASDCSGDRAYWIRTTTATPNTCYSELNTHHHSVNLSTASTATTDSTQNTTADSHTHTLTSSNLSTLANHSHSVSQTINNVDIMNPYEAVYIWRRTA